MELRLLGSGGWIPTAERETCCLYLRKGDEVLVVDAGSGLGRLVRDPELVDGVRRLSIVLTHFHLDHTVGLAFLPGLTHIPEREVWGPAEVVGASSTPELLHRLLDPPFLAREPDDVDAFFTAVHELEPGVARVGPFCVEARVQPQHPSQTLALKLDGWIAYCTDTAHDEQNVGFARGARLLLHEAWHADDGTEDAMHTAAGEAARVAAEADVERLVLIHVHPCADEEALMRAARARFPAVELGRDGPLAT